MTSKRSRLVLALLCAAPAALQAQKSVWTGVFTESQAGRGESVFAAKCARCHVGADVDGPPLTGDPFLDRWREDTLSSLFNFIKQEMPQDTPGKLEVKDYVDVLAFLLSENSVPAGGQELTPDTIRTALLVGKDGPKPLPVNALVKVVGCLTQNPDHAWTLTRAGDFSRVRSGDAISTAELATSATLPLGTQTIELPNLPELAPAFSAEANQSHKVIIKGVLGRRATGTRVNALSASSLAADCSK